MSYIKNIKLFRAEQLCIMHLTRFNEIKVFRNLSDPMINPNPDPHVDLLFDVRRGNFFSGNIFGVNLKIANGQDELVRVVSRFNTTAFISRHYPIILIIFNLTTDKGNFVWINFPSSSNKIKTMNALSPNDVKDLNMVGLNNIVSRTKMFYSK